MFIISALGTLLFKAFAYVVEVHAMVLGIVVLFVWTAKSRPQCDCCQCLHTLGLKGMWTFPLNMEEEEDPSGEPVTPAQNHEKTFANIITPLTEISDGATCLDTVSPSPIPGALAAPLHPSSPILQTTSPIDTQKNYGLELVSEPRLSSPRARTSPVISKEEFTVLLETSPHARKFVHALAMKLVAERHRRGGGQIRRSVVPAAIDGPMRLESVNV